MSPDVSIFFPMRKGPKGLGVFEHEKEKGGLREWGPWCLEEGQGLLPC